MGAHTLHTFPCLLTSSGQLLPKHGGLLDCQFGNVTETVPYGEVRVEGRFSDPTSAVLEHMELLSNFEFH